MSNNYKRTVKIITQQHILPEESGVEGFPMRAWSMRIYLKGQDGENVSANCFDRVTYKLHPTFANPTRHVKKPPFELKEKGWGEFDLEIIFHYAEKGGETSIRHDLHFQKDQYESEHKIEFKNPKPALARILQESGPVSATSLGSEGADPNGLKKKAGGGDKSKKPKGVDMERLAEGLQKLAEDDLVHVVQMIHDNKTDGMFIKNNIEEGEFQVDLYTLPSSLLEMLWKYTASKIDI